MLQTAPELQSVPLQQGWPAAPHWHSPPAQTKLALLQLVPPQQAWAGPPQAQVPALHEREGPQTPAQQASPLRPQLTQLPIVHVAPEAHITIPEQQSWPTAPHEPQVLLMLQAKLLS